MHRDQARVGAVVWMWNVSPRFVCLNIWFSVGLAITGGCGTLRRQGLTRGNGHQEGRDLFPTQRSVRSPSHMLLLPFLPHTRVTASQTILNYTKGKNSSFLRCFCLVDDKKGNTDIWEWWDNTGQSWSWAAEIVGEMCLLYKSDDLCSYPQNPHKS